MRSGSRLLLGDDLVLDGVIGVLGNDLLVHEFVLGLVRTALDDRLGPSRANLGQSIKLIFAGRVDVDEASLGRSRRGRGRRCGLRGWCGWGRGGGRGACGWGGGRRLGGAGGGGRK